MFRRSTVFFLFCLFFCAGVGAAALISAEQKIFEPWAVYLVFLSLAGGYIFARLGHINQRFWLTLGLGAFFVLGVFRYISVVPGSQDKNTIVSMIGQEENFKATVTALPRVHEKSVAYIVTPEGKKGNILLTSALFPKYNFGEVLQFSCKLAPLNEYEQYARKDQVHAACAFPSSILNLGKNENFGRLRSALFSVREVFHARLLTLFPAPYGGLLAGILYGDVSGLTRETKDTFRLTGISHITALSGYNITIIARMLMAALIFLWITRKQAVPLAILIISGFVVATGAEASVTRAAIMGFLVLVSRGFGRLSKIHVALALAGAVMLAINPYLLRFDLGFQLSFLATVALLWLTDDFAKYTPLRFLPKILGVQEAGAASAAAILLTLPLLLYVTGRVGPFSLLANILVVPVVPIVMALGFFAVVVDFLFHPFGLLISYGARVILEYIIGVAQYFSKFAGPEVKISAVSAAILFVGIVVGLYLWKRNLKAYELASAQRKI